MIRPVRAGLKAAAVSCAALLAMSPAAWAISPPTLDPDAQPPSGNTGAAVPMTEQGECSVTGALPGTDPGAVASPNQRMLNLTDAWRFSRGDGQTVAVIDTGVKPGPRLPNVQPGGDYVGDSDGLTDCDGHGTLVAGVIAGQPGDDAFSGVAPAAQVLAIRQTSTRYSPRSTGGDPILERAAVDLGAMARSVVHAADLGARVINISTWSCLPADNTLDQTELGAALRYAAEVKDVVIVAAAGNASATGISGGASCQSNPINRSVLPDDPRNWSGVTSVSTPSWWQPYVLSVGSLTSVGQPSKFTLTGPWVGIAAPGENIVSVNNGDGGLANGAPGERGKMDVISGTSFASAYVSGVAALVRSRFPDMRAADVIKRLTATAHNGAREPSNLVGAGTIDPVAALTWELPPAAPADPDSNKIAAPVVVPPEDHLPRNIAFAGTGALVLAVAATAYAVHRRKERSE